MEHDILIVEDEPFFARMCAKALAGQGRWVRIAENGKRAIEEIRKKKPDLLLLDLLLPEVDGFSVIAYLREFAPDLPVVILSNLGDASDSSEDLSSHLRVAAYHVKSETPLTELATIVDKHLGRLVESA